MPPSEFEIIETYFRHPGAGDVVRDDVALGVGDDAALLAPPPGTLLAVTTDTLLAGVHFPLTTSARAVGHKSLAVNLSDLAAMGAEPAWVTLALTLPQANHKWLAGFCEGFDALAQSFGVQRVGGDLVRGELSVTVQAIGLVPADGGALRRDGARVGDDLYVSGTLGDAGLALMWHQGVPMPAPCPPLCTEALDFPQPRVALGLGLRGLAHACIDLSDSLIADLMHILRESGVGATVHCETLPMSPEFEEWFGQMGWVSVLCSGDDYELCFSAPPSARTAITALASRLELPLHRIGVIEEQPGLRLLEDGRKLQMPPIPGYDHFK